MAVSKVVCVLLAVHTCVSTCLWEVLEVSKPTLLAVIVTHCAPIHYSYSYSTWI